MEYQHQRLSLLLVGITGLLLCVMYLANFFIVAASKETSKQPPPQGQESVLTVDPTEKSAPRVSLTFDDGPSKTTDAVLDLLKAEQIPATFFVIGATSYASPARYRRIIAEGHTIGLHSYSHDYSVIYRSVDDYIADTKKLSDWIYTNTLTRPTIYRMPGGGFTCPNWMKKEIQAYFSAEGYTHYLWDIDPKDASGGTLTASDLTARVIAAAKEKSNQDLIVLLHDNTANTSLPEALPQIIAYFREAGYLFSSLS